MCCFCMHLYANGVEDPALWHSPFLFKIYLIVGYTHIHILVVYMAVCVLWLILDLLFGKLKYYEVHWDTIIVPRRADAVMGRALGGGSFHPFSSDEMFKFNCMRVIYFFLVIPFSFSLNRRLFSPANGPRLELIGPTTYPFLWQLRANKGTDQMENPFFNHAFRTNGKLWDWIANVQSQSHSPLRTVHVPAGGQTIICCSLLIAKQCVHPTQSIPHEFRWRGN